VPDHLAGKELSHFSLGTQVRLIGLIRGGKGRVDIDGLFAQEDDVMEFMVTTEGFAELNAYLEEPGK